MDGKTNDSRPPGDAGKDGTERILIATVAGIAFLVRLIYIFEISASPFFENLVIDCARYSDWGAEIAAGNWAGDSAFYQSPLYAYFLGVIYRFVTTSLFAVRIIQAAIGSGSCVLIYLLARRLFDRRAALLAGILAAAYAPFVYHDAMIMKTVFSIFLASLGLYLLLRARDSGRPRTWLACGLVWGAAGLVRENYLLAAGAFAAWYLALHLRDRYGTSLRPLWFYLAGIALVVLPVTIRNAVVGGELALVTSQAGQNFYIGNNPSNRTGAYEVEDFVIANPNWEEKSFREFAQKSTGREMSAGEVSAFYRGRALDWMSEKPGPAFTLLGRKFLLFFNNYEVADNQSIYFMERYSSLLTLDFLRFGLVAPLGLLGLVLLWRKRGELAPLYIFGIVYAVSVIAFYIFGRYRLPVVVALMPPAAFAVFRLIDDLRARKWAAVTKPAVILGCLFALVYLPAYRYHDEAMAMRFINLGQVHARLGDGLQKESRHEDARAEYGRALEAYADASERLPGAAEPHLYAGKVLVRAGELREAEKQLRAAAAKAPRMAQARVEIARLLFDPRVRAFVEAAQELEAVLGFEPENAGAKELYARVSEALRDTEFYEEILAENPNDTWALTYLGVSALLNREVENAFLSIEKALKLDPDYIPANNAMALSFLHTQNHDAAMFYAGRVRSLKGVLWPMVRRELESCPHHHHDLEGDDR